MLLPPQYVLHSVTQPNLNPLFFFCHLFAQLLYLNKMRQPPSSVDNSQRTLTQSFSSTPRPTASFLTPTRSSANRITGIITNIWHQLAVSVSSTSQHMYVLEVVTPVGTSYLVSKSVLESLSGLHSDPLSSRTLLFTSASLSSPSSLHHYQGLFIPTLSPRSIVNHDGPTVPNQQLMIPDPPPIRR